MTEKVICQSVHSLNSLRSLSLFTVNNYMNKMSKIIENGLNIKENGDYS